MNGCQNLAAFMTAERDGLRVAIAADRRLLSMQAGHEVTEATAKAHFIDNVLNAFAFRFRRNYCQACPAASHCRARFCATSTAPCRPPR